MEAKRGDPYTKENLWGMYRSGWMTGAGAHSWNPGYTGGPFFEAYRRGYTDGQKARRAALDAEQDRLDEVA